MIVNALGSRRWIIGYPTSEELARVESHGWNETPPNTTEDVRDMAHFVMFFPGAIIWLMVWLAVGGWLVPAIYLATWLVPYTIAYVIARRVDDHRPEPTDTLRGRICSIDHALYRDGYYETPMSLLLKKVDNDTRLLERHKREVDAYLTDTKLNERLNLVWAEEQLSPGDRRELDIKIDATVSGLVERLRGLDKTYQSQPYKESPSVSALSCRVERALND